MAYAGMFPGCPETPLEVDVTANGTQMSGNSRLCCSTCLTRCLLTATRASQE